MQNALRESHLLPFSMRYIDDHLFIKPESTLSIWHHQSTADYDQSMKNMDNVF